jgi:Family of unknown function (DUF5372)
MKRSPNTRTSPRQPPPYVRSAEAFQSHQWHLGHCGRVGMRAARPGSPLRKSVPGQPRPPSAPLDPESEGRLESKAHPCSTPLGWAEITHPFHPLHGRCFPILKTRRVSGSDTLVLRGTAMGTFAVPRQWTDQGDEEPKGTTFLDFSSLSALRELVDSLRHAKKGVDK